MSFIKDLFNSKDFIKVSIPVVSEDPKDFHTPMSINDTMHSKYGVEWQLYLPETIRTLLKRDFNIMAGEVLANKIFATQTVMLNPYCEWDIFEKICLSFNNTVPDFTVIEPLSMTELVWGYLCIKALQPGYEMPPDVRHYAGAVMMENGLMWCPWLGITIPQTNVDVNVVKDVWKSVDKVSPDDAVAIQIDRLLIIRDYVQSWRD